MVWVLEQNKKFIAQVNEFSIKERTFNVLGIEGVTRTERNFFIFGFDKNSKEIFELGKYKTEEDAEVAMCKICALMNEDKKCIEMP